MAREKKRIGPDGTTYTYSDALSDKEIDEDMVDLTGIRGTPFRPRTFRLPSGAKAQYGSDLQDFEVYNDLKDQFGIGPRFYKNQRELESVQQAESLIAPFREGMEMEEGARALTGAGHQGFGPYVADETFRPVIDQLRQQSIDGWRQLKESNPTRFKEVLKAYNPEEDVEDDPDASMQRITREMNWPLFSRLKEIEGVDELEGKTGLRALDVTPIFGEGVETTNVHDRQKIDPLRPENMQYPITGWRGILPSGRRFTIDAPPKDLLWEAAQPSPAYDESRGRLREWYRAHTYGAETKRPINDHPKLVNQDGTPYWPEGVDGKRMEGVIDQLVQHNEMTQKMDAAGMTRHKTRYNAFRNAVDQGDRDARNLNIKNEAAYIEAAQKATGFIRRTAPELAAWVGDPTDPETWRRTQDHIRQMLVHSVGTGALHKEAIKYPAHVFEQLSKKLEGDEDLSELWGESDEVVRAKASFFRKAAEAFGNDINTPLEDILDAEKYKRLSSLAKRLEDKSISHDEYLKAFLAAHGISDGMLSPEEKEAGIGLDNLLWGPFAGASAAFQAISGSKDPGASIIRETAEGVGIVDDPHDQFVKDSELASSLDDLTKIRKSHYWSPTLSAAEIVAGTALGLGEGVIRGLPPALRTGLLGLEGSKKIPQLFDFESLTPKEWKAQRMERYKRLFHETGEDLWKRSQAVTEGTTFEGALAFEENKLTDMFDIFQGLVHIGGVATDLTEDGKEAIYEAELIRLKRLRGDKPGTLSSLERMRAKARSKAEFVAEIFAGIGAFGEHLGSNFVPDDWLTSPEGKAQMAIYDSQGSGDYMRRILAEARPEHMGAVRTFIARPVSTLMTLLDGVRVAVKSPAALALYKTPKALGAVEAMISKGDAAIGAIAALPLKVAGRFLRPLTQFFLDKYLVSKETAINALTEDTIRTIGQGDDVVISNLERWNKAWKSGDVDAIQAIFDQFDEVTADIILRETTGRLLEGKGEIALTGGQKIDIIRREYGDAIADAVSKRRVEDVVGRDAQMSLDVDGEIAQTPAQILVKETDRGTHRIVDQNMAGEPGVWASRLNDPMSVAEAAAIRLEQEIATTGPDFPDPQSGVPVVTHVDPGTLQAALRRLVDDAASGSDKSFSERVRAAKIDELREGLKEIVEKHGKDSDVAQRARGVLDQRMAALRGAPDAPGQSVTYINKLNQMAEQAGSDYLSWHDSSVPITDAARRTMLRYEGGNWKPGGKEMENWAQTTDQAPMWVHKEVMAELARWDDWYNVIVAELDPLIKKHGLESDTVRMEIGGRLDQKHRETYFARPGTPLGVGHFVKGLRKKSRPVQYVGKAAFKRKSYNGTMIELLASDAWQISEHTLRDILDSNPEMLAEIAAAPEGAMAQQVFEKYRPTGEATPLQMAELAKAKDLEKYKARRQQVLDETRIKPFVEKAVEAGKVEKRRITSNEAQITLLKEIIQRGSDDGNFAKGRSVYQGRFFSEEYPPSKVRFVERDGTTAQKLNMRADQAKMKRNVMEEYIKKAEKGDEGRAWIDANLLKEGKGGIGSLDFNYMLPVESTATTPIIRGVKTVKSAREAVKPVRETAKPVEDAKPVEAAQEYVEFRLPDDLRGSTPKYGTRGIDWAGMDLEMAIYTAMSGQKSKRKLDFIKSLQEAGLTNEALTSLHKIIKDKIKKAARESKGDVSDIKIQRLTPEELKAAGYKPKKAAARPAVSPKANPLKTDPKGVEDAVTPVEQADVGSKIMSEAIPKDAEALRKAHAEETKQLKKFLVRAMDTMSEGPEAQAAILNTFSDTGARALASRVSEQVRVIRARELLERRSGGWNKEAGMTNAERNFLEAAHRAQEGDTRGLATLPPFLSMTVEQFRKRVDRIENDAARGDILDRLDQLQNLDQRRTNLDLTRPWEGKREFAAGKAFSKWFGLDKDGGYRPGGVRVKAFSRKGLDVFFREAQYFTSVIQNQGFVRRVATSVKSGKTARQLSTLVNNLMNNLVMQAVMNGDFTAPITLWKDNVLYQEWLKNPLSIKDKGVRAALEAAHDTGLIQTDFARAELGSVDQALIETALGSMEKAVKGMIDDGTISSKGLTGWVATGTGKGLSLAKRAAHYGLTLPGDVLKKAYGGSDNVFKASDIFRGVREAQHHLASLKKGDWYTMKVSETRDATVRVLDTQDGYHHVDIDGKTKRIKVGDMALDRDLNLLAAREAGLRTNRKFFNYKDLTPYRMLRRRANIDAFVSPFYGWTWNAMWIPGLKRGWMRELFGGGAEIKTNSRTIQSMLAQKEIGRIFRRQVATQSLISASSNAEDQSKMLEWMSSFRVDSQMPGVLRWLAPGVVSVDAQYGLNPTDPQRAVSGAIRSAFELVGGAFYTGPGPLKEHPLLAGKAGDDTGALRKMMGSGTISVRDIPQKYRESITQREGEDAQSVSLKRLGWMKGVSDDEIVKIQQEARDVFPANPSPWVDALVILGGQKGMMVDIIDTVSGLIKSSDGKWNTIRQPKNLAGVVRQMLPYIIGGGTTAGALDVVVGLNWPESEWSSRHWGLTREGQMAESKGEFAGRILTGLGGYYKRLGLNRDGSFPREKTGKRQSSSWVVERIDMLKKEWKKQAEVVSRVDQDSFKRDPTGKEQRSYLFEKHLRNKAIDYECEMLLVNLEKEFMAYAKEMRGKSTVPGGVPSRRDEGRGKRPEPDRTLDAPAIPKLTRG